LEWAEIITIGFPMGDPWAHLDLADGSTLQLQALQRYDGEHAISGARLLRDLVRQRGEAAESPRPERAPVAGARLSRAGPGRRRSDRPAPRTGRPPGPRPGCGPSWSSAPASPRARPAAPWRRPR